MDTTTKELIELVLHAAGTAGAQGWGYLVHWTVVNAVTSLIGNGILLVVFIYLFRRMLLWKPTEDCDADLKAVIRALAMIVLGICCIISFGCAVDSIRDMIAPEGAAIHNVLTNR